MTQAQYDSQLANIGKGLRDVRAVLNDFNAGERGRATLTVIWRYGWKAYQGE